MDSAPEAGRCPYIPLQTWSSHQSAGLLRIKVAPHLIHDHNFKIGLGRKLSPDSPTSTIESGCTGITSGPNLSCASFLSSFSNSSSSRSSPASSRSKTVHIQRLQLFVCTGISTALPDFPPLHRSVKTVVSSTVGKRGCNCFHSILWRYREKTNAPSSQPQKSRDSAHSSFPEETTRLWPISQRYASHSSLLVAWSRIFRVNAFI